VGWKDIRVETSYSTIPTTRCDVMLFDLTSFRKAPMKTELARAKSSSLKISERNYDTWLNNVTACSLIRDTRDA
jgi:hypothetical protein